MVQYWHLFLKRRIEDALFAVFIGNEPFAVLIGDDIVDSEVTCLKQMIDAYDEYKTTVLGVQEGDRENVDKYGILDLKHIENRVYKVKDMVEKLSV